MKYELEDLPLSIWTRIVYYLPPPDLKSLLLVNKTINEIVLEYVYHELKLSEWSDSGTEFLKSIIAKTISFKLCLCIKTIKISFFHLESIPDILALLPLTKGALQNIINLKIETFKSAEAFFVADKIKSIYSNSDIEVRVQSSTLEPLKQHSILNNLSVLRMPKVYLSDIPLLSNIEKLSIGKIVDDQAGVHLVPTRVLQSLDLTYEDYILVGRPSCKFLVLKLTQTTMQSDKVVVVNDSILTTLKVVADTEMPQLEIHISAPNLSALLLCNIPPLTINTLLESTKISKLDFLSIAPITVPTLKFLTQCDLHYLKHVVLLVMRASLISSATMSRRKEFKKLVLCIQNVAARFPVDVIDKVGLLNPNIFYSEGLWRLTSQTQYEYLLPYVTPPPLRAIL